MNNRIHSLDWMLPLMLLLFILQVLLLPVVIGVTYASRSLNPEHILTYVSGTLTWDLDTVVEPNGWARLSLFDSVYQNAEADNVDALLAPGTENDSTVRLKNNSRGIIHYTAVLWYLPVTNNTVPAQASLNSAGSETVSGVKLPDYIPTDRIIRTVQGEVFAGQMHEFDINWSWDFEDKDNTAIRDALDTILGNRASSGEADEFAVGFYIQVEDDNQIVTPTNPKTGDGTTLCSYVVLMGVSGCVLLLMICNRKRKKNYDM